MVDSVVSPTSSMSVTKRESGAYGMTQRKMGDAEIDAATIAEGPIEVAKARTKVIQDKIDIVTKQKDTLRELHPDLLALSKTVDTLRGMSKASGTENVFQKRLGAAFGKESKFDQSYIAVNPQDGASIRSFKMKIMQQASSDVLTSGAALYHGSKTLALGLNDGNLTINGASVAITNTMTLEDVANAINSSAIFNVKGVKAEIQTTTLLGLDFHRLNLVPASGGKITITDDQGGAIKNNLHCVSNEYLPLGLNGDLVIDGRTVTIDANMTLYDIRNSILVECSQQSEKATDASVDKRGDGDNRLFLSRKDTGEPISLVGSSPLILSALGWTLAGSGKTADNLIAKFSIDYGDGNWIDNTRKTNTIDDLIEKLSLTITGVTPVTEEVTVSVEPYLEQIKSRITSFVDLTNKVLSFLNKQNERGPDGKPVKEAVLEGNNFLRDLAYKVQSSINTMVAGLGEGDFKSLQELGITLNKNQEGFSLKLNETTLNKALNSDPDKVMRALSFRFESSNGSFLMPTSPKLMDSSLGGKDIGVRVSKQLGIVSAYLTLNGIEYAADIDEKGKITPRTGTPLTSLSSVHLMSSVLNNLGEGETQSSTLKITQGVLDVLGNRLKDVVQKGLSMGGKALIKGGAYENEDKRIADDIQKNEAKIEKINEKAEKEREKILVQFERMQGVLEMAKQMRAMIASYFAAQNKQS